MVGQLKGACPPPNALTVAAGAMLFCACTLKQVVVIATSNNKIGILSRFLNIDLFLINLEK
jgi:hypothetical protein